MEDRTKIQSPHGPHKQCSVASCLNRLYARKYCCKHYSKYVRIKPSTKLATFYSAKARNKVKDQVYKAYGGYVCNRCGISDRRCLSIDHINNDGAAHRKAIGVRGGTFYRWIRKNNYPPMFQILCMNCQWIKRAEAAENV